MMKILSIISYACPAWFSLDRYVRCTMPREQMVALERLQEQCLLQIAQTHEKTSRMCLRKELEVMPLETYFEGRVIIFQARAIKDGSLEHLRKWRCTPYSFPRGKCDNTAHLKHLAEQHPYHVLEAKAKRVMEVADKHGQTVERIVKKLSFLKVSWEWDAYCEEQRQKGRKDLPTIQEKWGDSFKHYKGLNRLEGTLVFRCRTGGIDLNKSLFQREVC